jgi:ketosteroid isomerase-like protein
MSGSTSPALSPREVFERQRRAIYARQWSEISEMYADDAVVELPFNLPQPLRLVGREQLHARFMAGSRLPLAMEMRNLVVHQTHDPEVIVAEFEDLGHLITDPAHAFSVASVIVMRVRDGRIVASRDYHNHAVLGALLGDVPELTTPAGSH